MADSATDSIKGILQTYRYPALAIVIIGLLNVIAWLFIRSCSGDPHLRKAKEFYEAGNFAQAASEAEIFISNNPNVVNGYNILGDAQMALAEFSRGDFKTYMEHACAAIKAYKKSVSIAYNNNIASKAAVLEMRTQGQYDSEGKPFGCENTAAGSAETGAGSSETGPGEKTQE